MDDRELHDEGKQVTRQHCRCRKAHIQRNHIRGAFLVGLRFEEVAVQTGRALYQMEHGLLDDYLIQQLKNPSRQVGVA